MRTPTPHSRATFLALTVFLASGIAFTQDDPNRPPWAQKPKAKANSSPTTVSSKTSSPPASNPDGEPGKIVQPTAPPPKEESPEPAVQGNRIRVNVNLVTVLVSVLDDHNRPAPDLPREAFQLFDEGKEQEISVFEPETSQPLDLALMIDASMSAHKEIAFEQEAAAHFIRQVVRPGDRLAVFSFDEDVRQHQPGFSDNVAALQAAVRKIPDGAGTSIYDAVLLGSRALAHRGDDRRRVIILVTDAGETTSRSDFEAARREAVGANVLLYTIVIRPVKNENGRNTAGEHALETMTDTTGGAVFYPDSASQLDAIFTQINRELRTQYRLGYYPMPKGPVDTYRRIEVNVVPLSASTGDTAAGENQSTLHTYSVRHRKTYYTGSP